jgi:hypothetical protein
MLYGSFFLQYSYVQTAYEAVMCGSYTGTSMTVHNLFDYNNTFVVLENGQPEVYWNTKRFSLANQVPYVSYSEGNTTLVVGFTNTYIIQENAMTEPDIISLASASSLNIPSSNVAGIGYTSLASLVPLETTSSSDYIFYYLSGVAGIGFTGTMYATIQVMNILNSNNTYQSVSAVVVPFVNATPGTLTQYGTTSLWYNFDLSCTTLTVWVSTNPAVPSFYDYLAANKSTIMTSDMIQLTAQQIESFYSGFMGDHRMGATDAKAVEAAKAAAAAKKAAADAAKEAAAAAKRAAADAAKEAAAAAKKAAADAAAEAAAKKKAAAKK